MKRLLWIAGLLMASGMGPAMSRALADEEDRQEHARPAGPGEARHAREVAAPSEREVGAATHREALEQSRGGGGEGRFRPSVPVPHDRQLRAGDNRPHEPPPPPMRPTGLKAPGGNVPGGVVMLRDRDTAVSAVPAGRPTATVLTPARPRVMPKPPMMMKPLPPVPPLPPPPLAQSPRSEDPRATTVVGGNPMPRAPLPPPRKLMPPPKPGHPVPPEPPPPPM